MEKIGRTSIMWQQHFLNCKLPLAPRVSIFNPLSCCFFKSTKCDRVLVTEFDYWQTQITLWQVFNTFWRVTVCQEVEEDLNDAPTEWVCLLTLCWFHMWTVEVLVSDWMVLCSCLVPPLEVSDSVHFSQPHVGLASAVHLHSCRDEIGKMSWMKPPWAWSEFSHSL